MCHKYNSIGVVSTNDKIAGASGSIAIELNETEASEDSAVR